MYNLDKRTFSIACHFTELFASVWFLPGGRNNIKDRSLLCILLVFSVTPFKIDQNKNQNCSIDKVQNLGNERRYIYKDPHQDWGPVRGKFRQATWPWTGDMRATNWRWPTDHCNELAKATPMSRQIDSKFENWQNCECPAEHLCLHYSVVIT